MKGKEAVQKVLDIAVDAFAPLSSPNADPKLIAKVARQELMEEWGVGAAESTHLQEMMIRRLDTTIVIAREIKYKVAKALLDALKGGAIARSIEGELDMPQIYGLYSLADATLRSEQVLNLLAYANDGPTKELVVKKLLKISGDVNKFFLELLMPNPAPERRRDGPLKDNTLLLSGKLVANDPNNDRTTVPIDVMKPDISPTPSRPNPPASPLGILRAANG